MLVFREVCICHVISWYSSVLTNHIYIYMIISVDEQLPSIHMLRMNEDYDERPDASILSRLSNPSLRPLRISRSDVVARRSFQQVLQELQSWMTVYHMGCFILFPAKKTSLFDLFAWCISCNVFLAEVEHSRSAMWFLADEASWLRWLSCLSGVFEVCRISMDLIGVLDVFRHVLVTCYMHSRTKRWNLANVHAPPSFASQIQRKARQNSESTWSLRKSPEKLEGHVSTRCLIAIHCSCPCNLPFCPFCSRGKWWRGLEWCGGATLVLPHLRDVKLTDRWSRAVAPSPGCFKWSLSRRNCHGWWRLAG